MKREGIAIIGSVGIPNRYGGFESFVEHISPDLVRNGRPVMVTCDKKIYKDDLSSVYNSVKRIFIPISANGVASPFHDFWAFLAVAWKVESILILGVSGGPFFLLFRLLSSFFGAAPFAVNIDGVEWQRGKFGPLRKVLLFLFDWFAQFFAYGVIYDNEQLKRFVLRNKKAVCIAYSGDHANMDDEIVDGNLPDPSDYALTICRIEPENNCEMLIRGFLKSDSHRYIFVGNWDASEYGRELRLRYRQVRRLDMRDPTYDKRELHRLRSGCSIYLHGHSVGGTNPSLVEMLFYDAPILCLDVGYHRATVGDCAGYFADENGLVEALCHDMKHSLVDRTEYRLRYSSSVIADNLDNFLRGLKA